VACWLPGLAPCHPGSLWRVGVSRAPPGPRPCAQARWMPLPGLLYAPVSKQARRQRVVGGNPRVVFGAPEARKHVLAACGWQLPPSLGERLHLAMRQRIAAGGRRGNTLCQGETAGSIPWRWSTSFTTACDRTRACASRWPHPCPCMARAPPRGGGRVRQPGRQGGRIMAGRAKRRCSIACHRGPSPRRSKQRRRLMSVAVHGGRARRGQPSGLAAGWKPRFACGELAD